METNKISNLDLQDDKMKKECENVQLHQIGRPLIRLIEIQMIFKFFAYIKCVSTVYRESQKMNWKPWNK